tara:strand:- start:154 stop:855 length:702 start_codon:yes stop_codon:yes gene_type:complete
MNDKINFEIYLFISSKKFIISAYTETNKIIYEKKLLLEIDAKNLIFEKLDLFLNDNIFKIEKILKNFVKNIFIILDFGESFPVELSIKRRSQKDIVNLKNLNHLLYEAKDCCKKTIENKKIIHMLINNYQIDNKNYSFFPDGINGNSFSLDIKFICISDSLVKDLEKILKKYQISLSQVVSAKYIEKFLIDDEKDIFLMAKKIINGHNLNEVVLVKKTHKMEGLFEKFFKFFN